MLKTSTFASHVRVKVVSLSELSLRLVCISSHQNPVMTAKEKENGLTKGKSVRIVRDKKPKK